MTDIELEAEADVSAVSASTYLDDLAAYAEGGTQRAYALGNRGPFRTGADGHLHPDILEAYETHGFYVFEGVVDEAEVAELRADVEQILGRAPVRSGAQVDARGRPAFGREFERDPFIMVKPLADPWGGTKALGGRHQAQMVQPTAEETMPEEVPFILTGMCQTMPSGLRLYGHPALLNIAASINGSDFVPYNDATFVKQPGVGGSVAWHQDGVTYWNSPNWDPGIHGFNFQVQLHRCTAFNALWVMPGTHTLGKIDILQVIKDNGGSEQLTGAVPLICEPGDVTIVNRHALHGSFANASEDPRISLTFGFHRRSSILGAHGALSEKETDVYDEARIDRRSAVIAVAIDARGQHRPDEPRFAYAPFVGREAEYRFNETTWERVIRNYNLYDLSI